LQPGQHREAGPGFAAREANVTELMARMGHARAALIYQHVDPEREREIAQALSKTIDAERPLRDVARESHEAETDAGELGTMSRWARRESNPRHLPCKWHGHPVTRDYAYATVPVGTRCNACDETCVGMPLASSLGRAGGV
jgi:hypothetical protein